MAQHPRRGIYGNDAFTGPFGSFVRRQAPGSVLANIFPKIHSQLDTDPRDKDNFGRSGTSRNPLGLDDNLLAGFDQASGSLESQQDLALGTVREGREDLRNIGLDIQGLFDRSLNDILETTRDPFTDELRGQLEGAAFSNINEQVSRLSGDLGASRRGRGLSSGGSTAVGNATNVGLAEIGLRQETSNELLNEQRRTNTEQDRFIAGIRSGLTVAEAESLASIGKAGGALALGEAGLIDQTGQSELIQDILSAQFGVDSAADLVRLMEEAIESGNRSLVDQLIATAGPLVSAKGFEAWGALLSSVDATGLIR